MGFDNRKWVIITLASYTDSEFLNMIDNAMQDNINTVKKTTDNSKALLKWDGDTPSCFNGMVIYSQSQILTELAKDEW